jgi:hypothetical protein
MAMMSMSYGKAPSPGYSSMLQSKPGMPQPSHMYHTKQQSMYSSGQGSFSGMHHFGGSVPAMNDGPLGSPGSKRNRGTFLCFFKFKFLLNDPGTDE